MTMGEMDDASSDDDDSVDEDYEEAFEVLCEANGLDPTDIMEESPGMVEDVDLPSFPYCIQAEATTTSPCISYPNEEAVLSLEMFLHPRYPALEGLSVFAPSLVSLSVMKCRISCIKGLTHLTELRHLWLGCNEIEEISGLDTLHKLERLHLEHNCIRALPTHLQLPSLVHLSMSHNQVSKLTPVQGLTALRSLNIAANALTGLSTAALESLPMLEELILAGNPISSFAEMPKLRALSRLRSVVFSDPIFGPCPVSLLSNFRVFCLYHVPGITYVDGILCGDQDRERAETVFVKKKMFYSMQLQQLRAKEVQTQLVVGRLFRRLLGASNAMEGRAALAERLSANPALGRSCLETPPLSPILTGTHAALLRGVYDRCTEAVRAHYTNASHRVITELETGGNVSVSLATCPEDSASFTSCQRLLESRFDPSVFTEQGVPVSGIAVHKVTRTLNRFTATGFERSLQDMMYEGGVRSGLANKAKDRVEYLFLLTPETPTSDASAPVSPQPWHDGPGPSAPDSHLPDPLSFPFPPPLHSCPVTEYRSLPRLAERGLPGLPPGGVYQSGILMTNSMGVVDGDKVAQFRQHLARHRSACQACQDPRLRHYYEANTPKLRGQVLVLKTVLTKVKKAVVSPEARDVAPVRSWLPSSEVDPASGVVYLSHPADSRQRVYVCDGRHTLVEYLVEYEYTLETSASASAQDPVASLLSPSDRTSLPSHMDMASVLRPLLHLEAAYGDMRGAPPEPGTKAISPISSLSSPTFGEDHPPASGVAVPLEEGVLDMGCLGLDSLEAVGERMRSDSSCLSVSFNPISSLASLPALPMLTHLDVSHAHLTQLGLGQGSLPYLETLSLAHNRLSDVKGTVSSLAQACPQLRHLCLCGNPLWDWPGSFHLSQSGITAALGEAIPSLVSIDSRVLYRICTDTLPACLSGAYSFRVSSKLRLGLLTAVLRDPILASPAAPHTHSPYPSMPCGITLHTGEGGMRQEPRQRQPIPKGHGLYSRSTRIQSLSLQDASDDTLHSLLHSAYDVDLPCAGVRTLASVTSSLSALTRLRLDHNPMLDLGCLSPLPCLEELSVCHCNVTSLAPLGPTLLRRLLTLDVSCNHISDISPLCSASSLSVLHLAFNKVSALDALQPMRGLVELYIDHNRLCSTDSLRVLAGVAPSLTILDVSDNCFPSDAAPAEYALHLIPTLRCINGLTVTQQLQDRAKGHFRGRVTLDLLIGEACMSRTRADAMDELAALTVLDLSGQGIRVLTALDRANVPQLTKLDLSHNEICSLATLGDMPLLETLNLADNKISLEGLYHASTGFPCLSFHKLTSLDLSHNRLDFLPRCNDTQDTGAEEEPDDLPPPFGMLVHLQELHLGHNAISVLETRAFGCLPGLLHLDISYNPLRTVCIGTFDGCYRLTSLLADRVGAKSLEWLSPAKGSPVLHKLRALSLCKNRVTETRELARLSSLPELTQLNLQGNSLCRKHGYLLAVAQYCPDLAELDGKPLEKRGERERENEGGKSNAFGVYVVSGDMARPSGRVDRPLNRERERGDGRQMRSVSGLGYTATRDRDRDRESDRDRLVGHRSMSHSRSVGQPLQRVSVSGTSMSGAKERERPSPYRQSLDRGGHVSGEREPGVRRDRDGAAVQVQSLVFAPSGRGSRNRAPLPPQQYQTRDRERDRLVLSGMDVLRVDPDGKGGERVNALNAQKRGKRSIW
ncbi:hypothetical protein KIPB_000459 [Kipferlia bialata]|uniref:Uncharacterized protein n=1 Tax=Kipferlia bialata TaxID=797122 RepID=A0A9K3CMJ6_9EUKA|nr:hypothetical protein KIPB_000459 [Kipferlia bialata]|eukprot:g459.t1